MDTLNIAYRSPTALQPRTTNPRTHSKKQIRQIADSIKQFGFINPILIDREGRIVAGHGRIEAAKLLGIDNVPTIRLEDLTEAEIRAYVIADNKLAENAGWNPELLAVELQGLIELDLEFDVEITGFEMPEIDILIEALDADEEDDSADQAPVISDGPPVTRPGDIWCIGKHRLICGNSLDSDTYTRLLDGSEAQMVFTDPPYNVPIDGHVSGLGKVKHAEFAMASGEMSAEQFTAFLATAFKNLARYSADGAINFICMDWRHMAEVMAASKETYTELKNLCIWAKTNGGMGSLYRSQHELVFVFKAGIGPHINNVELGKYGRSRTNIWRYPGINSFGKNRDADLALHPTVKPVKLVADAVLDCSKRGGIVLDAFAGSGTTLVAAEKTGRRGYVPARMRVLCIRRPKYGCRTCGTIHQAPAPERPIAKGMATPGLIAHVLVSKYCDHLPLYRQSQIFARQGVNLNRSTLANWVGGACWWLEALHARLAHHVFASDKLFADDTPIPVLDPGRGRTKTGRLWVYARDDRPWAGPDPPAAVYYYSPDRKAERPAMHLDSFRGILQVDGYAGFERLAESGEVVLAACWAHARRKFYEFEQATGSPIAAEALRRIAELYAIEKEICGRRPEERQGVRNTRSRPLVEAMKPWLENQLQRVPPRGALAEAIRYTLARWPALCRYLDDGRIELDNNAVERAIRPVALGRKNHLFAGSDGGADRWAIVASLLATAKLNDIEPYAYLKDVLERMSSGHPMNKIDDFLPWNWKPSDVEE